MESSQQTPPVFLLPNIDKYSETQQAILKLLGDGRPHEKKEIKAIIGDPQARKEIPGRHIRALKARMNINDPGFYIAGELGLYRMVRYILVRRIQPSSSTGE